MRKRERDTGRETLQVLYLFSVSLPFVPPSSLLCPPLLLTFLLLFRFYFYWSHVFFFCVWLPHFIPLQTIHKSSFDPVLERQLVHTATREKHTETHWAKESQVVKSVAWRAKWIKGRGKEEAQGKEGKKEKMKEGGKGGGRIEGMKRCDGRKPDDRERRRTETQRQSNVEI